MPLNLFEPKVLRLEQVVENPYFEIPTFQRDVVWTADQMVTLIDSVYRGIPINSLYIWNCEGIWTKDGTESDADTQLVIDGQQRLTALKAMLLGEPYYNSSGNRQLIEVAFHPIEGTFRKVDNRFRPSDKHVPNLATFYANPEAETKKYENRNERKLTAEEKETVAANLKSLQAIKTLPVAVYQISSTATLEQVYLCFERTNTGGTKVSKADLCMAWLEVYQQLLAEGITFFSQGIQPQRGYNIPNTSRKFDRSKFAKATQWIRSVNGQSFSYHPKVGHVAGLLFNILQDGRRFNLGTIARQLLSDTGNASSQNENQARVDNAFLEIVNQENFNRFNQIIGQFPGINSTDKGYAYWLFLRCRREPREKGYTGEKIARLLQRWYLLQLLSSISATGPVAFSRYLPGFAQAGGMEGYLRTLEAGLPENFWTEGLPSELREEVAKTTTPKVAIAWEMVQILQERKALFDDAVLIERLQSNRLRSVHHLYPQDLLKKEGVPERKINAIANRAITTKEVNSRIGNRKLHRFIEDAEEIGVLWSAQEHLEAHCIPNSAGTMPYEEFLAERARLMAARIQKVYEDLKR